MQKNAHPIPPERSPPAVFGVVNAFFEIGESAAREQGANFACDRRLKCLFQERAHKVSDALRGFQGNITDKTVGDDYVDLAVVDIAPFDVADEIDGQLLQQLIGLACNLVALAFFFANGKQPDAGPGSAKHAAEINLAHHCELLEVVRLAVDVSSDVEQSGNGTDRGRDYSDERGAVNARQTAKHHLCRGHGRAGVSGANECGGLSIAHQAQTYAHG